MLRVCPDVGLVPDISKPRTRPVCKTESRSHAGQGNEASWSYFAKLLLHSTLFSSVARLDVQILSECVSKLAKLLYCMPI